MSAVFPLGPLGLYIHVPFCRSICPYCSFNVIKARAVDWDLFVDALLCELRARFRHDKRPLVSLYFGGGTPSLMPTEVLGRLIYEMGQIVTFCSNAEWTIEAEPDTVTPTLLTRWKALGMTRVSVGWQSTHDRILKRLGRRHTAHQGARAIENARQAGFARVSADLIFAVPTQTLSELQADLDQLTFLAPDHISLYALTYHEKTPFFRARARGQIVPATEALECAMMDAIETTLTAAGYLHYEVSNFSRPHARGRHNELYWQGGECVGIGPGAHSFVRMPDGLGRRWQNIASVKRYQELRDSWTPGWPERSGAGVAEVDRMDARDGFIERMIGAMRHADGILLEDPCLRPFGDILEAGLTQAQALAWVESDGVRVRPTALGMRHADSLAGLFV